MDETPAAGHLALPVGNQARLLQPVLLVPAQGLEAAPQGHEAAVDGHALPEHKSGTRFSSIAVKTECQDRG